MTTAITLAPVKPGTVLDNARASVQAVEAHLRSRFVEMDAAIHIITVSAIAKGNVVLMGSPGTAKSALLRSFTGCVRDTHTFVRLCHKQMPVSEMFGDVDAGAALRGEPLRRLTGGTIVEADFAFLDEPGKASGVVLNPLLMALNERTYTVEGEWGTKRIPLRSVVMATNECLADDPALEAFADRRIGIALVSDPKEDASWETMLANAREAERGVSVQAPTCTLSDLDAILDAAGDVEVSRPLLDALHAIRRELAEKGVRISPRRMVAVDRLLRVEAAYRGDRIATTRHLPILVNALWDKPEQVDAVADVVLSKAATWLKDVRRLEAAILDEESKLPALRAVKNITDGLAKLGPIAQRLTDLSADIDRVEAANAEAAQDCARLRVKIDEVKHKAADAVRVLGFSVGSLPAKVTP